MDVPDYSLLADAAIDTASLSRLGELNDTAERLRAQLGPNHPDVQAAEQAVNQVKGACCERICVAANQKEGRTDWGLFRKDAGQHWTRSDGANCSTDIAFNKRLLRFVDAMADRHPSWSVLSADDPNIQPEKWVAPLAPPPDDPPDPPPVDPPSDLPARVAALEAAVMVLAGKVTALENAPHVPPPPVDLKPLEERIAVLEHKRYRVVGKTQTAFAHQHTIGLLVEELK